jgi:hypothetical protein
MDTSQPSEIQLQTLTYTSRKGRQLTLTVDLLLETAVLGSDQFYDIDIVNDCIQNGLLSLRRDEARWMSSVWQQLFRRDLGQLPFSPYEFALRALDPDP